MANITDDDGLPEACRKKFDELQASYGREIDYAGFVSDLARQVKVLLEARKLRWNVKSDVFVSKSLDLSSAAFRAQMNQPIDPAIRAVGDSLQKRGAMPEPSQEENARISLQDIAEHHINLHKDDPTLAERHAVAAIGEAKDKSGGLNADLEQAIADILKKGNWQGTPYLTLMKSVILKAADLAKKDPEYYDRFYEREMDPEIFYPDGSPELLGNLRQEAFHNEVVATMSMHMASDITSALHTQFKAERSAKPAKKAAPSGPE